jgi:hypothetical protein
MTDKRHSPFKTVSENLPFYPNKELSVAEQGPFIGLYEGSQILGENVDTTKNIPVFIFVEYATGEKFFISQSYAIKKAVDAAQKEYGSIADIVFQFLYKGKGDADGKPFNLFTTGYCTLEEYEASLSVEEENIEIPEKKKKK